MSVVKKQRNFILMTAVLLVIMFGISLMTGKYPLTLEGLFSGDLQQQRVFWTLRLPRTCIAVMGGFALGIAGMVYQVVFRNPLAAPDIVGVSSGASAGAAFALLFLNGTMLATMLSAFAGSLAAVILALALAALAPGKNSYSLVLSGIAVHALAQTVLMLLKLTADPERELAAIEYWIMGSLNGITMDELPFTFTLCICCIVVLILCYRQILLLSVETEEAALLGMSVVKMRMVILMAATMLVAAVVSVTGIISFVGLLAPHCARMIMKHHRISTLWLSGICGGIVLTFADILARSAAISELPVSIFTSLIGAPFLLYLLVRKEPHHG